MQPEHHHNPYDPSLWPKETAGHRMTTKVPTAHLDDTFSDVQRTIVEMMHDIETINYIYVLDDEKHLVGVLSIKDLYRHPSNALVGEKCRKEHIVTVKAYNHQERVAYTALKHNIKAVPVVNQDHVFLGVITSDTILSILHKEMHEDTMRRAGVVPHGKDMFDNVLTLPILSSIVHRLPWLFLGLLGGLFAAKIIGTFERILEANLLLAAFIPLIVYMSGAVGTQMEAFMIRDLAVDSTLPFVRYLLRQLVIIVAIGLLFAFLLFLGGIFLYRDPTVSTVLSVSIFAAITSSVCTGLFIPYTFSRFKMDPANASGPIATIIQDILSIIIYFSIASLML